MYEVCSSWSRFRTGSLEAFFHPAYILGRGSSNTSQYTPTSANSGLVTTASRPWPFFSFMRGCLYQAAAFWALRNTSFHHTPCICNRPSAQRGVTQKGVSILILRYPRTASAYYRFFFFSLLTFLDFLWLDRRAIGHGRTLGQCKDKGDRSWARHSSQACGFCIMIDCINTVQ